MELASYKPSINDRQLSANSSRSKASRKAGAIQCVQEDDQSAELRRLRAELKRLTEERDILKKAAAYFAKECG